MVIKTVNYGSFSNYEWHQIYACGCVKKCAVLVVSGARERAESHKKKWKTLSCNRCEIAKSTANEG